MPRWSGWNATWPTAMSDATDGVADSTAGYEFRPLTVDDAENVARLHIAIWRDTYAGMMPAEKLASLDAGRSTEAWRRWLGDPDGPQVLAAVERDGGQIVGWITVGEPRDEDAPAERELWVLNVDKGHHGTGVAHELLRRELPDGPAYLWVVDGNLRAQAFYRKHGFELDGVGQEDPSGAYDLRMTRH